jgi:hypothetical protein
MKKVVPTTSTVVSAGRSSQATEPASLALALWGMSGFIWKKRRRKLKTLSLTMTK